MISVAEQFANLKTTLGSILGIYALLRYLRTLFAKLTGRPPPADATSLTPAAFASFQGLSSSSTSSGSPNTLPNGRPTPSRKPFLIFLAAVFGLPYLMAKLIRSMASSQQQHPQNSGQQQNIPYDQQIGPDGHPPVLGPDGTPLPNQPPLDPRNLIFCRALYDFTPPTSTSLNGNSTNTSANGFPSSTILDGSSSGFNGLDLSIKKGDLVAVLTKLDPMGQPSEWWRCRSRDGRVGWLPGVYLEEIKRNNILAGVGSGVNGEAGATGTAEGVGGGGKKKEIEEAGRVNTLTSLLNGGVSEGEDNRTNSLGVEVRSQGTGNTSGAGTDTTWK